MENGLRKMIKKVRELSSQIWSMKDQIFVLNQFCLLLFSVFFGQPNISHPFIPMGLQTTHLVFSTFMGKSMLQQVTKGTCLAFCKAKSELCQVFFI